MKYWKFRHRSVSSRNCCLSGCSWASWSCWYWSLFVRSIGFHIELHQHDWNHQKTDNKFWLIILFLYTHPKVITFADSDNPWVIRKTRSDRQAGFSCAYSRKLWDGKNCLHTEILNNLSNPEAATCAICCDSSDLLVPVRRVLSSVHVWGLVWSSWVDTGLTRARLRRCNAAIS